MHAAPCLFIVISCAIISSCDYWTNRKEFLAKDEGFGIGASLQLSEKEEMANGILMRHKRRELDEGFKDILDYPPAMHFFQSKTKIEGSEVFKILQRLPKGALLHAHDLAVVSQDYLFNLTYRDNLYGCQAQDVYMLNFFNGTPDNNCDWLLLSELRTTVFSFDDFLRAQFTLRVDDPGNFYPTLDSVWQTFQKIFQTLMGMLTYKPVWEDYFYQLLKETLEDNVRYLELRGTLPSVYDLNGKIYDEVEVVGMYRDVLERFKRDHPSFYDAKFIYSPQRRLDNETMDRKIEVMFKLLETYPDFVVGFDLVGQEDPGRPLTDYLPQLQALQNSSVKFFFHAGETNWYGASTDLNLIDAVLLGTRRIGHGYALLKHPAVAERVKEKDIAIEVSPISNQVLKLVDDMRNHPASILIAEGYPVVICSDDPSFWGAKGLSYDWYMAFMGLAGRDADLKLLKQLANNSLWYSAMEERDKAIALDDWSKSWDQFIDSFYVSHNHNKTHQKMR